MLRRKLTSEQLQKITQVAKSTPQGRKKMEEWNVLLDKLPGMMDLDEKEAVAFFEKHLPLNWKVAYPRVYSEVSDYHSPKGLAGWLMTSSILSALGQLQHPDKKSAAAIQEGIVAVFQFAQRNSLPQFFIGREILEAILQTDVPKDLAWWEVKFPFKAGFLYIPRGSIISPLGAQVQYIGWAFLEPEDFDPSAGQTGCALQIAIKVDDSIGSTYTKVIDSTRDKDLFDLRMESMDPSQDPYAIPMTEDEDLFMVRMMRLTISLLMLPSAREELWEKERRDKVVRKGDRVKEFWTPNYIGRKWRALREQSLGGTHSSPRAHWRRGHYRNQKHGKDYKMTKLIWIEPTLVMGEDS